MLRLIRRIPLFRSLPAVATVVDSSALRDLTPTAHCGRLCKNYYSSPDRDGVPVPISCHRPFLYHLAVQIQYPSGTPQPFSAGWVGQSVVSSIGASTPPRRVLPLRWRGWRHAGYRAWRVPIGDTVARSVGPLLRCRVMCESNMAPSCAISNSAHILSVRATHHRHDPSDPPH